MSLLSLGFGGCKTEKEREKEEKKQISLISLSMTKILLGGVEHKRSSSISPPQRLCHGRRDSRFVIQSGEEIETHQNLLELIGQQEHLPFLLSLRDLD